MEQSIVIYNHLRDNKRFASRLTSILLHVFRPFAVRKSVPAVPTVVERAKSVLAKVHANPTRWRWALGATPERVF